MFFDILENQNGPSVQLEWTLPCHGRDHGFESRMDRKDKIMRMVSAYFFRLLTSWSLVRIQPLNTALSGTFRVAQLVRARTIHPVFYLNLMGMHSANFTKSNFYFDKKRIPKFGLVAQLDRATAF